MSSCSSLSDLAQSIWVDLGSPSDLSVAAIQTKLSSVAFLGELNTMLDTCYVVDPSTSEMTPALGDEEQAIYNYMYQVAYYTGKLNNTLNGYGTSFITIQDGDSRITKSSVIDVARLYRDQQAQLTKYLGILVSSYRADGAQPSSIDMLTIESVSPNGFSGPGYRGYNRS